MPNIRKYRYWPLDVTISTLMLPGEPPPSTHTYVNILYSLNIGCYLSETDQDRCLENLNMFCPAQIQVCSLAIKSLFIDLFSSLHSPVRGSWAIILCLHRGQISILFRNYEIMRKGVAFVLKCILEVDHSETWIPQNCLFHMCYI